MLSLLTDTPLGPYSSEQTNKYKASRISKECTCQACRYISTKPQKTVEAHIYIKSITYSITHTPRLNTLHVLTRKNTFFTDILAEGRFSYEILLIIYTTSV